MNGLIKKNLSLFSNLRFILPYKSILKQMCNELETKHIKKLSSFYSNSKQNINYWHEIIKALFNPQKEFGINYLAFCYLSSKAKEYFPKFISIANKEKVGIDIVVDKYFELSDESLGKRRQRLTIDLNKKQSITPSNRLSRSTKAYHSFDNRLFPEIKNKESKKLDLESNVKANGETNVQLANEAEKNKRIFSIFVGKLDIKSFMRKEQTFRLEKGDCCQYFIISDNINNNHMNTNSRLRRAQSNQNTKYKNTNLITSLPSNKKLTSSSSFQQISTNDPLTNHLSSFKDRILLKYQKNSSRIIRLQKSASFRRDNNSFLYPARIVSVKNNSSHLDLLNKRIKLHADGNQWNIISKKYCPMYNLIPCTPNKKRGKNAINYINKNDLYY